MRPRSRDNFAIAIICALPLEAEAVEALFDDTYDRLGRHYGKQRGDANAYINGRIGKHDVVLCYMPGMGKGSAAGVASSLLVSYPGVKLALVAGICGGAPPPPEYKEIFLGDVIISDSVIEYDFGRQYPGGFQWKTGVKDTLGRPGREIRALLNGLRAENARRELQDQAQQYLHALQQTGTKWRHPGVDDILFKARYLHKHYRNASAECSCFGSDTPDQICEEALGKDCNELYCYQGQQVRRRANAKAVQTSIYIGPVASADTVMKSGQHRDEIVKEEKVIGFEMEGAGVWDNVPCIIVKGVCDYADSHKSKVWQAYAAATGASVAKAFLEYWMPANHKDTRRHRQVMIPFAKNPHFVGRQKEIQILEDLISAPDGPRKLAITGLGGVGKTQIALELAYRIRDREPECSIFWIPCTSYEAVEQACMSIAQMVGVHDVEPAEVKQRLQAYLSQSNEKWILIFDNADEFEMWTKGSLITPPLKDFIPSSENGQVIFTSRNQQLALKLAGSNVVSIPDVDRQTSKEIFQKLLMRKHALQDDHVTNALLDRLAFLPLAISQAAAYINQNDISLARYMSLLGEQEASIIELLGEEFEDNGRYAEIQNPVATTWLVSFLQIQQVDEVASGYLSFMACINPRDIPESILPATPSTKRRVEALGLLKAYSFIRAQVDDSIFSLHRLVHLATRNWLRKRDSLESWVEKAAGQLDKIFPNSNHENRQKWREYLSHALYLANSTEFQALQDNYHDFLARTGSCLQSDGRYGEAEIIFRNVLGMRERVCGPENRDTLTSVSQLGSVLAKQGKYKEAEAMHQQALQGCEKVLGPEHPRTLNCVGWLGLVLERQGKYKEAEAMHQQALKGREKVLGPKHPDTLASISNLNSVLARQGKYKDAEAMHRRDLLGSEKVLGPEHPHTLTSVSKLGSVLERQGKYKEAEAMHRQALQGREKVLGPEHPDTLTSMHNLAFTLKQVGRVPDALSLLKKCADLRNQVLGSHHPHAMSSTNALRAWETAPIQSFESQQPCALLDNQPLYPASGYASDDNHIALASKPVSRKRRVFVNFFRR
ncbi:putative kinesin light chain [Aspergillus insuetus]